MNIYIMKDVHLSTKKTENNGPVSELQEFFKKIISLVIHNDEGWKVLNCNHEDSFHAQFGVFKSFNLGNEFFAYTRRRSQRLWSDNTKS